MFCQECGKEVNNDASFCASCGAALSGKKAEGKSQEQQVQVQSESKVGIGVLLCLFLGIIGLIIGICIYTKDEDKATFIKGWGMTFLVEIIASVFYLIFTFALFM